MADGSVFAVLETKSGQIVLRVINPRPKLTLIEHLLKFKGVEIPEMHFHAKPRV